MKPDALKFLAITSVTLLCIIMVTLIMLAATFASFAKDFHKAYFPDYSQNSYPLSGVQQYPYGYENYGMQQPVTQAVVDEEFLKLEDAQWVSKATASSTYNGAMGTTAWSADMATGKPDVVWYGDNGNAWASQNIAGNIEHITLTFDKAVYATGVNIKESYGSGAVIKVEAGDENALHVIWEGTDATRGLNWFKISIDKTAYKVDTVKITLDTNKKSPNEWAEIDAVQLVGK